MGYLPSTRARLRRAYIPRHTRSQWRGHRIRHALSLTLVFTLTFTGSALALSYSRFQSNINQRDISVYLGDERPTVRPSPVVESTTEPADPHEGEELNILVIGSDSREGANVAVDGSGTSEGMRSDTTMIVHVSADRSRVEIVSIPRDTLVDIPSCTLPDGSTTRPQSSAMFNSAFSTGGRTGDVGAAAACTILTVEELTGLYIDDFVVVDFAGFVNVIDALGGIAMYIPEDIDDRAADLEIEQGCRLLDGTTALGVARVRKSVGDGTDISRIGRQQDLVAAVIREALSTNLLRNPARLYRFLDSATSTLTTGHQIGDIPEIAGLARSLSSIRAEDVTFITMPFAWSGYRVVPATQYVDFVWDALLADQRLDSIYSGDAPEIALAVKEREAAADDDAAEAQPAPPPALPEDSETETGPAPEPPDPDDGRVDPTQCTKENAS